MASLISSTNNRSYFKVPNPRSRVPFWPGLRTRVRTSCSSGCDSDELYDLDTGETLDDTVMVRSLHVQFLKTLSGWKVSSADVGDLDAALGRAPER